MAHQKKFEYVQTGEYTERQWFLKGFLLNEGTEGAERYTNSTHQKTAIYYNSEQVHEGGEEWKQRKKELAHEAYLRKRETEKLWKHRQELRDSMNTEYQWLFEIGRIPNKDARWLHGEDLNRRHETCSYGSSYFYCHERDTHEPKDETELKIARWRSNYRHSHGDDPSARKESSFSDEEILESINRNTIMKESEDIRKKAVDSMVEWAKSTETEPTSELKESLELYFESRQANDDKYNGEPIGLRELTFSALVIDCISQCSSTELAKLDSIKEKVCSL